HPTTKMLALAFLLLIGVSLVADGLGFHIPKGYIYAAMGFSVLVEAINILAAARRKRLAPDAHRLKAAALLPDAVIPAEDPRAAGGTPPTAAASSTAAKPKAKPRSRAQARPKSAPRKKS